MSAERAVSEPTASDDVTDYAVAVVDGRIVAGPLVRAACRRHLGDLETGAARGLSWHPDEVARIVGFFADVLTVEVESADEYGAIESRVEPFRLAPPQVFIAGSLFGWRREANDARVRRFRRAYVEMGKGSGKSPLGAGIGLYMLTAQGKLRAECYAAATEYDQAAIPFRDAVAMYERSKALRRRLVPSGINPVWQLTHAESSSIFRPIAANRKGKSGFRPYYSLVDEVHEHPNDDVIEMLRAGTKGNKEALMLEITNSGFDRNSVCRREHEYSMKVVDGDIENDAWFAYIAALDQNDDPFADEECWIKANPLLGVTIHADYIREQVTEARGMPGKEARVRRLHFCQWTDVETRAIPRHVWEACEGDVDLDEMVAGGYPCFGGLDLSRTGDLSAYTLTWVIDGTPDAQRFVSKTWFWTPQDTLVERGKRDAAPYDLWVRQGRLIATPGSKVRYDWVAGELVGLNARFNPLLIGADWYGWTNLMDHLTDLGADLPVVMHPQGFQTNVIGQRDGVPKDFEGIALWMPDSINKLESALLEHRITVERHPVMATCCTNTVYAQNRTGHRMFDKEKAHGRIDGMVSLAMSIGVATVAKVETGPSFWQALDSQTLQPKSAALS